MAGKEGGIGGIGVIDDMAPVEPMVQHPSVGEIIDEITSTKAQLRQANEQATVLNERLSQVEQTLGQSTMFAQQTEQAMNHMGQAMNGMAQRIHWLTQQVAANDRHRALELAIKATAEQGFSYPDKIVMKAKEFYAFLHPSQPEGDTEVPPAENNTPPGVTLQ